MTTTRAYDPAAKEERRRVILAAAARLLDLEAQLPPVGRIAEAAGLAKGTVYLYFRTKEEILAVLLLEGWRQVMEVASRTLEVDEPASQHVRSFIAAFVDAVIGSGRLMRLDALARGVLEENMSSEALSAFKIGLYRDLEAFGEMLDASFGLTTGRGVKLIMRTHALTRGLWQSFEIGSDEPFAAELKEALMEYWWGALQLDEGGRPSGSPPISSS